jgi:two-component system copper resistance phosphate regulon response regulator CusR
MLPKITGWELIPLLRKRKPTLPILAVTAKTAVEDRVQGLNLGCDDYLVKPFSFAELLARIQVQLRRGITLGTAELKAADLVLDPLKRKVTRAGKSIELSNKEFATSQTWLTCTSTTCVIKWTGGSIRSLSRPSAA